jgi:hypothetical protein
MNQKWYFWSENKPSGNPDHESMNDSASFFFFYVDAFAKRLRLSTSIGAFILKLTLTRSG